MFIEIDVDEINFDEFFQSQQTGNGVLIAHRFQRGGSQSGQGLGNIFKSLWSLLFPLARNIAPSLGKAALKTTADIASDILQGSEPVQSVKNRVKQSSGRLLSQAGEHLQKQSGMGRKIRRPKRAKPKQKKKKVTKRKKAVSSRKRPIKRRLLVKTDALGQIIQ